MSRFIMGKKQLGGITSSRSSTPSASRSAPPPHLPTLDGDRRIGEYSSLDDVCPVCKSDRYLKPNLRLMVSFCYHKMCESCIDRIFSLGPEPCPSCGTTVRKAQFRPQVFESLGVQKEVAIRKRTSKIFNKRQEDFKDLKSYNDYLETFEDLTFNLINNHDVAATEAKIKQYEAENRALIESNLSRTEHEAELVKLHEEEDRRAAEEAKRLYEEMDEEDRRAKEEERAAVLQSLESSTASTASILSAARLSSLKRSSQRTAPVPSSHLSSLFANLIDPNAPAEAPEDLLKELGWFDSYEELYEVRRREVGYEGMESPPDEGGFVVEEVWEKCVRSAVAGLWLSPLSGRREEEDVVMEGA